MVENSVVVVAGKIIINVCIYSILFYVNACSKQIEL